MQQRPGDVIVPKGRVLVTWDFSKDAQGVLVFPLMDEGDPDALLSEQVGGVQGQSLLEFGDRVVEEADVVVDHPELVVRVLQARVERQRTAIALDKCAGVTLLAPSLPRRYRSYASGTLVGGVSRVRFSVAVTGTLRAAMMPRLTRSSSAKRSRSLSSKRSAQS